MIFIQGSWGSVSYAGQTYKMYGAYLHTPSEHTVSLRKKSKSYKQFGEQHLTSDLEIQLLHYSATSSKILMISLLFDTSLESNTFLDSLNLKDLLSNDEEDKEYPNNLNFNELFNGSLESKFKDNYHVRYEGSLTYSPCTEGVTWIIVLEKFKNLSSLQV